MNLPQQAQTLFLIAVLAAVYGCGSNKSTSREGDAAAGDGALSGGSTGTRPTSSLGTGGRGGGDVAGSTGAGGTASVGGAAGVGGASKTGGATGGASKTGGTTAGTTGTGGQGGTAGSSAGGAVKLDAGPPDVALDGAPAEVGGDSKGQETASDVERPGQDALVDAAMDTFRADTASGLSLDGCFAGLPPQDGAQMIATKSSSDGRARMRIALDTEDRMGTSGTLGWGLIRLGVEVDGVVTCITDRASLKYTGSHHNCTDSATATSGATTYSLTAPDRPTTTLTIQVNGTSTTTTLTDTSCSMLWSPGSSITCRSGGPC